jgi:hypothetical protein
MSFQVADRSHRCEPESCWRVDAGQFWLQPLICATWEKIFISVPRKPAQKCPRQNQ